MGHGEKVSGSRVRRSSAEEELERLWKRVEFKPNEQQRQAILHRTGPLYMPAGPGSGKTRVLLWRALNLLVFHETRPEEIYLSTFTEKAALQLREGLRGLLAVVTEQTGKPYDISKMYIGTVHSLCQRMLTDRSFHPGRQRGRAPVLMDELAQYLYLRRTKRWRAVAEKAGIGEDTNRIVNELFGAPSVSRHVAVSNCMALFNRLSEEVIDPAKALKRTKDPGLRRLLDLYRAYQESLVEDGAVPRTDFSLLQQEALRVLQGFDQSGHVFRHVIVDEYQDTNTVQEKLFFTLASGHRNICVVGDDDQALYRFRGATVENFVEFPERCRRYLGVKPRTIVLSTNYRSRKRIVEFYGEFIAHPTCNWRRNGRSKGFYRVTDKNINPSRQDAGPSVVASTQGHPDDVAAEIAGLVKQIVKTGKVENENQIAFLFPSLKSAQVTRMQAALEAEGLSVYAPRAGRFVEVDEATAVFGVFFRIFGKPDRGSFGGRDYEEYHDWVDMAWERAKGLVDQDGLLGRFVEERREEADGLVRDFTQLIKAIERAGWTPDMPYDPDKMRAILAGTAGLSSRARRTLTSPYFDRIVRRRRQQGQQPFSLGYVINRASSVDWTVLDLFYQLCGFKHFKAMFDLAERGQDEGPICNLSLISQYLSRFMDEFITLLRGEVLSGQHFLRLLTNYLYFLFRRGESEFEDANDPFPKGRIPFITIHQAKGLEFPVVVLANPRKDNKGPQVVERMVQPLIDREGEPLDRMSQFDIMRMFYVALSRAKNLLVIAHFVGRGQRINEPFQSMLDGQLPRIPSLDVSSLPKAEPDKGDLPQTYSYTGDFLLYRKCPRQYMIFREYGFVPSRSQTMFFGSLVHQTLEDLHQYLIAGRSQT